MLLYNLLTLIFISILKIDIVSLFFSPFFIELEHNTARNRPKHVLNWWVLLYCGFIETIKVRIRKVINFDIMIYVTLI